MHNFYLDNRGLKTLKYKKHTKVSNLIVISVTGYVEILEILSYNLYGIY